MPNDERVDIVQLEERLASSPLPQEEVALGELEMLADLYLQADSYLPALETIERLLALPAARTLTVTRRAALESKSIACRLARGDCQAALAHARELLRDRVGIESHSIWIRIHLQAAEALFRLGRSSESLEIAEKALAFADTAGDLPLCAAALLTLGNSVYRAGDLLRARDIYEQALALQRRLGNRADTAMLRNNLGLIHKNLCEWDAAVGHLRGALEIHRENGRYAETAAPLMNLGIVFQKSGDWARAAECYREAEKVFHEVGDQLRLANVAIGLGNIARLERRFGDAEGALQSALDLARRHGARREEVLALEFLGELEFDRGAAEPALGRYQEARRLADGIAPHGDLVVEIERRRAEALAALGRLEDAEQACELARRLARQTDDRLEHAIAHRVAGEIAWARGRREDAIDLWKGAAALLSECRERVELGRVHLCLGRSLEDPRAARLELFRAGALFAELSSPFWLEQSEAELQRLLGPAPEPSSVRAPSVMGRRHRAPSLVAASHAMRHVEALARRAAGTELSVLITGQTGTGKELIARTIHALSTRANRPFLAVNCGALRADLALSQLFGHRKGAFTGAHADGVGLVEAANGGTLFLDEVGELTHDVQVTLLRFLESGEYLRLGDTQVRRADVRMIAATNRDLRSGDGEKLFRRDLLFRLDEIEIRVPALRERSEDIVPLARHFLAFYGGLDGPRLMPDAESVLLSYPWPGNVRELENVMKRVAALSSGEGDVDAEVLLPFLGPTPSRAPDAEPPGAERVERDAILAAWREASGNKSRTAEILGVSRKTLYARLRRLNIEFP